MKVILNKCYGGFDVSSKAYRLYAKKKNIKLYKYISDFRDEKYTKIDINDNLLFCHYLTKDFGDEANISEEDYDKYNLYLREENRFDETLIETIEELGEKASGPCGNLKIIEIPDNCYYKIDEYDGIETIYYSNTEIFIK